jgi:hypothetical protein
LLPSTYNFKKSPKDDATTLFRLNREEGLPYSPSERSASPERGVDELNRKILIP